MAKNLIIVESPAKAKTIEGYAGGDYQVVSCNGHIRDLPKGNNAIDIKNEFMPTYVISEGKEKIVRHLKKLATQATCVYLASDDDREGESISWHLKEALELEDSKIKRIVFREITKTAIFSSLKNPRGIDLDLVNSQQARRVLDRLVGYDLSPLLWKKIKPGLSAGRVQSVAVRLVVERERAIINFQSTASFAVTANFLLDNRQQLLAELSERFTTEPEAQEFLKKCKAAIFFIKNLEKKQLKRSPLPPFITSTLQQEASRKLGYAVARTMALAQQLYETGKISYMRTDSVSLSQEAVTHIEQEIKKVYGDQYVQLRTYKSKSAIAQEAHEAIRPTNFSLREIGGNRDLQRLYDLIWKRTMASQMADAQLEKTTVSIAISTADQTLIARGEVLKFDGFLQAYMDTKDDDNEENDDHGMLPPLKIGETLALEYMKARERFTKSPARYTEATLVRDLEEQEIGRPSTYVPIISTIQKRGYIIKESREGQLRKYRLLTLQSDKIRQEELTEITGREKQKLFPTDVAAVVNDFLVKRFSDVTDYGFTAQVEAQLDQIAQGSKGWGTMLAEFYNTFHPKVAATANIDRAEVNISRNLGKDPISKQPIIVRIGRYGPMAQIGDNEGKPEEERKTLRFASLKNNQRIETITLGEALDLFKLPRTLGNFEEHTMTVSVGRFGPYIRHNSLFYSIAKTEDPLVITDEQCIEIIQAKRKADAERFIKGFDENPEVKILKGRWGPYIKCGKKNVRIPKDIDDPTKMTLSECMTLIEKAADKKKV